MNTTSSSFLDATSYIRPPRVGVASGLSLSKMLLLRVPQRPGKRVIMAAQALAASVVATETAWRARTKSKPVGGARQADVRLDRAHATVQARLTHYEAFDAAHPDRVTSGALLERLYPDGLGFLELPWIEEHADRYATDEKVYRKRPLGELATWYCKHLVDVNSWFEYRGDYCLVSGEDLKQEVRVAKKASADSQYGRLIRWSPRNIRRYLRGTEDSEVALQALREDYARIVKKDLDGLDGSAQLEVGRCIVLAERWPPAYEPDPRG